MLSRRALLQSAALASVAMPYLPKTASADDAWPAREIHSICGFPPGSGADVFVRFYSKKLEDKLGKDHYHREQGWRVRQHRDRVRREVQAGRLHVIRCAWQFFPRRRTEPVQEIGLRSGQRFRTRDDAVQAAIHPDRIGR